MKRPILIVASLLIVAFLLPSSAGAQTLKVRVTVAVANVRTAPELGSTVIQTAKAGMVFPVVRRAGDWYIIVLAGGGQGYISRSVVEEVSEPAAQPSQPAAPAQKPVAPKPAPQTPQPPVQPSQQVQPARTPAAPAPSDEPKLYVRAGYDLGFQEASQTLSFSRTVYYENADYGLDYKALKTGSIDAAVGYMFSRSLGVELGGSYTTRDLTETLSLSVPHPLWMGYPRTGTIDGSGLKLSEIDLYLNLVLGLRFSMFGLNLYGGPCFMMATATIVSDVTTSETGYPYMDLAADQPTTDVKKSVVGFNGGASLSVNLGRSFGVLLDARYVAGTGAFKPEGDVPELKLALGGLRVGGGLKVRF